ncbi:granulysin [Clarias gariepinus]|uniref:granulysin n=1 Tax=Clarias gariepinus TaxID=13013 RepID=UPI00234D85D1|nr:granulysin [Clarias gariepinus]
MSTLFQLGVLLLVLGAVQCEEQISSDNGFMIKTYEHAVQRGDKQQITCVLCKTILELILRSVGRKLSKANINAALNKVCNRKKVKDTRTCIKFVHKYKDKLVKFLMSGKGASQICKLLRLCIFF